MISRGLDLVGVINAVAVGVVVVAAVGSDDGMVTATGCCEADAVDGSAKNEPVAPATGAGGGADVAVVLSARAADGEIVTARLAITGDGGFRSTDAVARTPAAAAVAADGEMRGEAVDSLPPIAIICVVDCLFGFNTYVDPRFSTPD